MTSLKLKQFACNLPIQPAQIPLQSFPTLQYISAPAQLVVICKLTLSALGLLIQIIKRDSTGLVQGLSSGEHHWSPSPAGCNCLPPISGLSHPVSAYIGKWTPVQVMNSRMLLEIMSKGFLKPGKQYPQPLLYLLSVSPCHRKRSGESIGTCIKHLSLFLLLWHYVSLHI